MDASPPATSVADRGLALLEQYRPLQQHIIKRLGTSANQRADAMQGAKLGFLTALRRFDPSRQVPIGAYARGFIMKEVLRATGRVGPPQVTEVALEKLRTKPRFEMVDDPGFERIERDAEYAVVRQFVATLGGLDRQIYEGLFVVEKTQKLLAAELGLSEMQLSRAKRRLEVDARAFITPRLVA